MAFACDVSPWLSWKADVARSGAQWKDFGNGSRLGRLKREDGVSLVLYEVADNASPDAFSPHTHTGGEAYLVLEGEVYDDAGRYPAGTFVWMHPGSRHTPKTRGKTLILVLWPGGVAA
ncbi:MAG: cupin domain-containing protein [Thermoplasmatota archaeon]